MDLLEAREELDNLSSLIEVCVSALNNKEERDWIPKQVATTLFFVGLPLIKKIKEYCGKTEL